MTHTTKDDNTDLYGDKLEEDSSSSSSGSSSPPQHSQERRPGYGGAAASTSCPCPTGLGGDLCRAFGGGGNIVVRGGWGV